MYCTHILSGTDPVLGCTHCDSLILAAHNDRVNAKHIARFKRRVTDIEIADVLDLDAAEWPDHTHTTSVIRTHKAA